MRIAAWHGEVMADRGSAASRRRPLGFELRRLREAAGLTLEQVAGVLECSDSKISRIETGQVAATTRDVRDMLEIYEVTQEQQDHLLQAARRARAKDQWHAWSDVSPPSKYPGLEAASDRIHVYAPQLLPGLLQTRAYASALIRVLHPNLSSRQVDRWLELREVRQAVLRQDDPPELWAIIDEGVLRRPTGGGAVMHEQRQRLLADSARDTVTVQVLPAEVGEHAGMYGGFTILGFNDDEPDLVYVENATRELYLKSDNHLLRYADAFDRLRDAALEPDASYAWLVQIDKELT
jgi:transcriptional regulator with XRE-family HTH domain